MQFLVSFEFWLLRRRLFPGWFRLQFFENELPERHKRSFRDHLPHSHCLGGRVWTLCNFKLSYLLCLWYTQLCWLSLGPGKFLRGKGGLKAAEHAVQVLEDKSEITLTYFMLGLYCIVISSALKAFFFYSLINASIVCCGLIAMSYVLITSGKRIFNNMYVEKSDAIRGGIDREQVYDPTKVKIN